MKTLSMMALGLVVAGGTVLRADDQRAESGAKTKSASSKATVTAVGAVEWLEVAQVGAQVAGTVQKITVDHGMLVKRDEVLAQLDPAPYEAEVARAQAVVERAQAKVRLARAQFILAKRQLERLAKLRDSKTVEESEFETAKAQLDVAEAALMVEEAGVMESKAALRRAALDLSYCTIRAPIDGVIADRRCSLGQIAAPSAGPLFVIGGGPKRVQILAAVKETDILRIAAEQPVEFTVDALPGRTWRGRVSQARLKAARNKGSVTYTVAIAADNADGKLLPSMTARVSFATAERP